MSNRALTPEFEMSEMAPTTVTASVLANLGFMALELHEARDAAVRMKPNWKICNTPGCQSAARDSSGLCTRHGGGAKCRYDGCTKSSRGVSGLCVLHGGGKRCAFVDENGTMSCTSTARGALGFCVKHGGGVQCVVEGCTKAGRGLARKCVSHGGGRRCVVAECTKAARGSSGLCVRHGGGTRCQHPNCTEAAKVKSKFCRSHGAVTLSAPLEAQNAFPLTGNSSNAVDDSVPESSVSTQGKGSKSDVPSRVIDPEDTNAHYSPYPQSAAS